MINTKIKGSQNEGTIKCFIYEMYRYSSHREESEGTIQERVIAFHLKALNRLHDTFSSIRSSQSIFVRKDLDAHRLSTCALGGGRHETSEGSWASILCTAFSEGSISCGTSVPPLVHACTDTNISKLKLNPEWDETFRLKTKWTPVWETEQMSDP